MRCCDQLMHTEPNGYQYWRLRTRPPEGRSALKADVCLAKQIEWQLITNKRRPALPYRHELPAKQRTRGERWHLAAMVSARRGSNSWTQTLCYELVRNQLLAPFSEHSRRMSANLMASNNKTGKSTRSSHALCLIKVASLAMSYATACRNAQRKSRARHSQHEQATDLPQHLKPLCRSCLALQPDAHNTGLHYCASDTVPRHHCPGRMNHPCALTRTPHTHTPFANWARYAPLLRAPCQATPPPLFPTSLARTAAKQQLACPKCICCRHSTRAEAGPLCAAAGWHKALLQSASRPTAPRLITRQKTWVVPTVPQN